MPTDIRIDLQVEGMGVRGHRWLFITDPNKSWDEVDKTASALCVVYKKPVEVTMSTYEPYEGGRSLIENGRFLGRFVPRAFTQRGTIFIDHEVYAQID